MDRISDLRALADQRFEEALGRLGARDPRDFYRSWLRQLRERSPDDFSRATGYFDQTLIPAVADEGGDPIAEWLEYGRFLASLLEEGETLQIDPTGLAKPYSPPVGVDQLVLHLPTSTRQPALAVGLPTQLSAAQRATYDLLVARKTG
ncbi:MAG: hypothetical protein GEU90_07885 [Gemmatimonas sp.]|nr:hypothetical protein [Gemmatimonas sp.]